MKAIDNRNGLTNQVSKKVGNCQLYTRHCKPNKLQAPLKRQ